MFAGSSALGFGSTVLAAGLDSAQRSGPALNVLAQFPETLDSSIEITKNVQTNLLKLNEYLNVSVPSSPHVASDNSVPGSAEAITSTAKSVIQHLEALRMSSGASCLIHNKRSLQCAAALCDIFSTSQRESDFSRSAEGNFAPDTVEAKFFLLFAAHVQSAAYQFFDWRGVLKNTICELSGPRSYSEIKVTWEKIIKEDRIGKQLRASIVELPPPDERGSPSKWMILTLAGSQTVEDWMLNFATHNQSTEHVGIAALAESINTRMQAFFTDKQSSCELQACSQLLLTGHSQAGGALGLLAQKLLSSDSWLAELNKQMQVNLITFGSAAVLNLRSYTALREQCNDRVGKLMYSFVNAEMMNDRDWRADGIPTIDRALAQTLSHIQSQIATKKFVLEEVRSHMEKIITNEGLFPAGRILLLCAIGQTGDIAAGNMKFRCKEVNEDIRKYSCRSLQLHSDDLYKLNVRKWVQSLANANG